MTPDEMLLHISTARSENRLVLFVGSGVSANSGIPTWSKLIEMIASTVGYSRCDSCGGNSSCSGDCAQRNNFSQDEFLKIPQFLFNTDKDTYERLIRESISATALPNTLHRLLLELRPKHFITTNYDHLLETTDSHNQILYSVVKDERNLFEAPTSNYILKMHGDIEELSSVVLKEDDYLCYAQTHVLMELFIKSLFLNHTFVFVGYSINDNNLKLIMSWINYYAKLRGAEERAKHFFIDINERDDENTRNYFETKDIYILSSKDVAVANRIDDDAYTALSDYGQRLYRVLYRIRNYDVKSNVSLLFQRCQIFKNQKAVYYQDLMRVLGIQECDYVLGYLSFHSHESKPNPNYEKLETILESATDETKRLFAKAGIYEVCDRCTGKTMEFACDVNDLDSQLQEYAISYDYTSLVDTLRDDLNSMERVYFFYRLFGNYSYDDVDAYSALQKFKKKSCETFFDRLQLEFNLKAVARYSSKQQSSELESVWQLVPESQKEGMDFLYRLATNTLNISVEKHHSKEHKKLYLENVIMHGNALMHFEKLQTLAFAYYDYINRNSIMIDHYSNPKDYFSFYIEAILLTYSPRVQKNRGHSFFTHDEDQNSYDAIIMSKVDLDILLRFCDTDKLKSLIELYDVERLKFAEQVDIKLKFHNFSTSVCHIGGHIVIEQLFRFILLLAHSGLREDEWNSVIDDICSLFDYYERMNDVDRFREFYIPLLLIAKKALNSEARIKLVQRIITSKYYIKHNAYVVLDILRSMPKEEYPLLADAIADAISKPESKWEAIFATYVAMSEDMKIEVQQEVVENVQDIKSYTLCHMIWVIKAIKFSDGIKDRILLELRDLKAMRAPGVQSFPDHIETTLSSAIILKLTGSDIDLSEFSEYASDYLNLAFLLDPEHFDYSKLKNIDYMWHNFLRNDELRTSILRNGKDVVGRLLQEEADAGTSKDKIRSVYYTYFYNNGR